MREGGAVGADDALWELGDDGVGEGGLAAAPDVRAAVGGGGPGARLGEGLGGFEG